jgi:hypothetical protein
MKKLFIKSLLFLVILIVADRVIGYSLQKLFYKQYHGDDYVSISSLANKADVLVLGSSRASHHFISDSIETYTGLSTFNGGRDNMGIHYVAAILQSIYNAKKPKLLILDLMPNNFMIGGQSSHTYFDIQTTTLLPFTKKYPLIKQSIKAWAPIEVLKTNLSSCYAFNSLVGTAFQNSFTHFGHKEVKGYEPIYNAIDTTQYSKPLFNENNLLPVLDTAALAYLDTVLSISNKQGVPVVITLSPFYFARPIKPKALNAITALANKYNTLLINLNNDSTFVGKPWYWYDELHLNDEGAKVFTKKVCGLIRAY